MDSTDIFQKDLDNFVDESSMSALKSLNLDIDFMFRNPVSDWKNLEDYKNAKTIVDSFKVVNDTAERALKLMTDINESHSSNEARKQQVVQVIEDNWKKIPNTKKSVLSSYKKLRAE